MQSFWFPLGVLGDVRESYAAFEVTLGIKFVAKLTLLLRIYKSKENLVTLDVLGSRGKGLAMEATRCRGACRCQRSPRTEGQGNSDRAEPFLH